MVTYTAKEIYTVISYKMSRWMLDCHYLEHIARNKYSLNYLGMTTLENLDIDQLTKEYESFLKDRKDFFREKYREITKKLWENPEYRNKVSKAIKIGVNKESSKKLKSEKSTQYWSKEENRKAHSEKVKITMSTPEYKENRKQISKELWKDQSYRNKVITSVTSSLNKDEVRKKRSDSMKKVIETTDMRKRVSETLLQTYKQNPELHKVISERTKRALSNPEVKHKISTKAKEMWADPVKRKQIMETRKAHYSKISKAESGALSIIQRFTKDVIQQYRSDLYPYNCDFYIESLDLYIECHYNWTHGGAPYKSEETWCKEQLHKWNEHAKTSNYYKNAIYTWTDLDVRKRQCAIDNKLNWQAVYSNEQLEKLLIRYFNIIED